MSLPHTLPHSLPHTPQQSLQHPQHQPTHSPQVDANRVPPALAALAAGRPVVVMDDADRENEADLIAAAELIDIATMALMIREGSGIVCLCLEDARVRQLDLPPMAAVNQSRHGTAFTVSIEAAEGVSTGVSAQDRITTIAAALRDQATPADLARPGHVFPLRAHPRGVLGRRGHTEAAVDLARLAGLKPAGVLCELMNADGTMMRGTTVEEFAAERSLPILTVADLVAWRMSHDC